MIPTGAVLDARQVLAATPGVVGGKAWQLARLLHFGLPVPDFVVLPATAWQPAGPDRSPEVFAALRDTLAARGWLDLPLAVRSSAVGEDGATASFAGIFRSCLNVCGEDALRQSIGEVRASLHTPAADAYRERLGLHGEPAMAVIVMPLIAAQASGIAFTCDPLSGRHDRLLVHAHWGLGESLVGGQAVGDEYVFGENAVEWQLLERRLGSKATMSVAARAGGTNSQAVSAELSAAYVFDAASAERLANLLYDAAVALDFVAPFYDLEWVWDGERFWLTQARPITARPYRTYDALRAQAVIWTRGNTCEVMPEPLSPCDWSFSRWGVNSLLEQGWRLSGYPLLPGVQRAGLFHGRLYLEASILQWEAWDALGLPPASLNALMGGHQPAIAVASATWRERLARARRMLRYLALAPGRRRRGMAAIERVNEMARRARTEVLPEDAAGLRQVLQRRARSSREETDLHFLQGSGGGALSMLVEMLDKAFPGQGTALAAGLMAGGEPSVTAQQGYALLALARLARKLGGGGPARDNPEFQQAFATFLAAYGHRGHYETYLRSPRLRDQPEVLLAQLDSLAEVDEGALRRRQRQAAEQAWQTVAATLPLWRRFLLRRLAKAANQECNQREAARSALIASLDATRSAMFAAARLAVARGAMRHEEDGFMLLASEAHRGLAGEIPPEGVLARVRERAAQFAAWQTEVAPEYLLLPAAGGRPVASASFASPAASHDDTWRGVATGTGVGRGRVRVLRHPAEGGRLLPGEILVAPSTDPGWTTLFLKAAGLVVETGGYLSHGAIVARELAIPAVVNLPGILTQLSDGDLVEVDGMLGTVTRLP